MEGSGCAEPCKRIDRDLRFSICMIVVGMSLLTAGSLMVILGHVLSAQLDSENANSLAIAGPVSLTISGGFVLPGLCLYFVRKRKSARRRRIPRSGTELVDLVFSSYPSLSDISPTRNYAPPPSYQEVMQMGLSVYPLSSNRVPSISVLDCTALDIRPDLPDSHAAGHRSPREGAADRHATGHRSPRRGAAAQTSESPPTRRETSLSAAPSPGGFQETSLSPGQFQETLLSAGGFKETSLSPGGFQETSLSSGPSPGGFRETSLSAAPYPRGFQETSLSAGGFQETSLSAGSFQETSLTEQEPPPRYEDVILT